jgi:hypothetical protein
LKWVFLFHSQISCVVDAQLSFSRLKLKT